MTRSVYAIHVTLNTVEDTNPNPRFGRNVQKYRKAAGLTQEELGEMCGLDRAYLSGVERGIRNPTIVSVDKIATALKIEVGLLFK